MRRAGFELDREKRQPGAWLSPAGIPVDLMVPEALAGEHGRRSADVPPHQKEAMRWAVGLEAAVVDNAEMEVRALSQDDDRRVSARVAGPAALIVVCTWLASTEGWQELGSGVVDEPAVDAHPCAAQQFAMRAANGRGSATPARGGKGDREQHRSAPGFIGRCGQAIVEICHRR